MRHGVNGYVEVAPGEFLRAVYTVVNSNTDYPVVKRDFRSWDAAERAMQKYLNRPDACEDVRIITDYTSVNHKETK